MNSLYGLRWLNHQSISCHQLTIMANVNALIESIKKNDTLSRSWRAASNGSTYAPVTGETWRVYPSEPFGSPLGGQTAVKGLVNGVERPFWPSWLVKVFSCPTSKGGTKVTLRGHLLDGSPISEIPLEELLDTLSTKDIKVSSIEAVIGLKKKYENGTFTNLVEEVVKLYSWETVSRQAPAIEETPAEE